MQYLDKIGFKWNAFQSAFVNNHEGNRAESLQQENGDCISHPMRRQSNKSMRNRNLCTRYKTQD